MQNAKNQNLLKLWLSFFCLSLANALASDSVGKTHAVHVNQVIRITVIHTQGFSPWNICAGSLIGICQTDCYTHSKGEEGLYCKLWLPKHECSMSSPHLPSIRSHASHADSWDENVSHGGHDSARHLRTTNCWSPTYLLLRLRRAQELTQRNSVFPALPPAQGVQQPEAPLTAIMGTAFCGTCTHITTRLKV